MKNTKYIFVTGGVLSGLGKGVSAASIGRLLKAKGFKIFVQKLDPYYNTDPGTMNPYQHGEVYVTTDGIETDLDLGHYERFIDQKFTKESNYTQGKILYELLNEEREGKYEGKTVQVVPHVTNKIMEKMSKAGKNSQADFVIVEIGGTVGDIESLPFIYAISEFARKNKNSCFFVHTTFVPYLNGSNEFKSKPTQQSVSLLQSLGVIPNMILLRSNKEIDQETVSKVARTSLIEPKMVIPIPNVDNIYKVPLHFQQHQLANKVLSFFQMNNRKTNLLNWKKFTDLIDLEKKVTLKIAMVGKYAKFPEAYKSIIEAINVSALWAEVNVVYKWIEADKITSKNIVKKLEEQDAVVVLPGFGKRGFNGKVTTIGYARDQDLPTLGICYGFQAMVVDQALRVGIKDATSSEIAETGSFVIDILKGKNGNLGGTLRLGESKTIFKPHSLIQKIYKKDYAFERHRHRYEVNNNYLEVIESKEFVFSGYDEKTNLVEVVEMPSKKFFVGLQAHPEFNSTPLNQHPLFKAFVESAIKNHK